MACSDQCSTSLDGEVQEPRQFSRVMSRKYQRLTGKEKRTIIEMHATGNWKGAELARLFQVTPARVSQLVCDYYGEHKRLGVGDAPSQ